MAIHLKPVRSFVLMGVAALIVCSVMVFYTHHGAHGRTAEERAAYEIGEKTGERVPRDAKLPTEAELNMIAQKYFDQHGSGDQVRNPPRAGGPKDWKQAFQNGYAEGYKKTHPQQQTSL